MDDVRLPEERLGRWRRAVRRGLVALGGVAAVLAFETAGWALAVAGVVPWPVGLTADVHAGRRPPDILVVDDDVRVDHDVGRFGVGGWRHRWTSRERARLALRLRDVGWPRVVFPEDSLPDDAVTASYGASLDFRHPFELVVDEQVEWGDAVTGTTVSVQTTWVWLGWRWARLDEPLVSDVHWFDRENH